MTDFIAIKKAYFLGIGGIGVSAIARMFLLEGKEVFGSDTAESEITKELQDADAKIYIGQKIENIPDDTDLIIYTIAIEKYAAEFLAGVRQKFGGEKVISYPQSLSIISKDKYTIAVCGTHGKTTTTAMIAKVLIDARLDPTVIVGSLLSDYKTNFIAGKSKYLVVEACEYCRSFLEINPTIVAVTTIDNDHMDYYKDTNDIERAFGEFMDKASTAVVGNLADKNIRDVITNYELRITNLKNKPVIINSENFYDKNLKLKIPGDHNRKNASVALAVAEFLSIDKNSALKSLEDFSGTWRRFEYKGKTESGAIVYDDYAHHPAEIEATLAGAKEMHPDKKITVVFQPHLYSRTKIFFNDFAKALSEADSVMMLPIYKAREKDDSSISSEMLVDQIKKKNPNVSFAKDFEEAKRRLSILDSKFLILIMGAGDISPLADKLIAI